MVLTALLVVLSGVTVWLTAAGNTARSQQAWDIDQRLLALEQSGEALAIAWIGTHGGMLVAPPDGGHWNILAERWVTPAATGWLVVTVYDGWAGVPVHLAQPRAPLRRALPWFLAGIDLPPETGSALYRPVQPSDILETITCSPGIRRFPIPPSAPAVTSPMWQSADINADAVIPGASSAWTTDAGPCLATALSPHSDGRINVNTAPLDLVEQVLRQNGGLVPPNFRKNREQGVPSEAPPDLGGETGHPQLVATSGVWNLHLTAGCNGRSKSWWVVVTGAPPNSRIVQRHVVDP